MNDPKTTQAAEKVVDAAADAIKTAARARKAETSGKVDDKRTGKPKAFTAPHDVYVDKRYYKAGEVFVTDAPVGDEWDEVTPKEAAAIEASTNLVPDDAQFDEASVEALQAYALVKHVPIVGIAKDRKALIDAIKAANEPAL